MLSGFDTVAYYGFVLEGLSRFGQEGQHKPALPFRFLRRRKPSLLPAVARRLRAGGRRDIACILEFGVYRGRSITALSRLFPEARIYGFDSFAGFPEDGRADWRELDLATDVPTVPANVELVVGPYGDTAKPFCTRHDVPAPARIIHIDCDLYSSTACVFEALTDRFIGPGTVIVFDELLNYDSFLDNEMLAFYEMLRRQGFGFEWFATIGSIFPMDRLVAGDIPVGWRAFREAGCYQNACVRITAGPMADASRFLPRAAAFAETRPLRRPLVGM